MNVIRRHFVRHSGDSRYVSRLRGAPRVIAGLVLVGFALQAPHSAAQEATEAQPPAVDLENWACDYCAFEEGWDVELTLGVGNVSDDSYKFGEYNGLYKKGSYLLGDVSARYRGEDAAYLDIYASDIGLTTRSLEVEGGRQGSYALSLSYDQIPHYISNSASTPYAGSGSDVLSLPPGWVWASSTAGMTALDGSLQAVELKTERKRLGAGIAITTESPWSYQINLRHEDKEGNKPGGAAFLFSSAQLVEPVDYATDEIDASVSYTARRWQGRIAYYASVFSNGNESLTFENAYSQLVSPGQLALPPDNQFHQLSLSLAYLINERNHLSGDLAIGRGKQDAKLLQATTNPDPNLAVALPGESADAEVETTNARFKYITSLNDDFTLSAAYSYDERDNKTPERMYEWVSTDSVLNSQRENLPYSYTRNSVEIKADYDLAKGISLGAGYDFDDRERTFQEIDNTSENTLWGTLRVRNIDRLFVEIKLASSSRDASTSEAVAAIDPPQNVLMRKYNMADRERDSIGFFTSYMPSNNFTFSVSVDHAEDDYARSELGLTSSTDDSMNLDVTTLLSETASVNVYLGRQRIESSQANSQSFSTADWFATTEDTFDTFGVGFNFVVIEEVMDAGIDFSVARSTGRIDVDSGAPAGVFPELRTDLESLRVYLAYRLSENLSLQAAYWHENYDTSDWALDGLEVDTVSNLLSFGQLPSDYSVDVVKLAMRYQF